MVKKILSIIQSAYRGTLEEQDDTVVWLCHALNGAGADVHILLRGNAVNYLLKSQDASGLSFGEWRQQQPPRLQEDVLAFLQKGAGVYFVEEDAVQRGVVQADCIEGAKAIPRAEIAKLLDSYDQVWHW